VDTCVVRILNVKVLNVYIAFCTYSQRIRHRPLGRDGLKEELGL